jgi:hypothetical protein
MALTKDQLRQYNAHLKYLDNSRKSHIFYLYVMEYDQPFELAGSEEQSLRYQHFYAKSYAPGDMNVMGRAPHQTQYNSLAEYIREFHWRIINASPASNAKGDFIPMLNLVIPVEGISVHGIIKSFTAGAKRFNVAPPFSFDFMVMKNDYQSTVNFQPSYTLRATWTGGLVGSATSVIKPKKKKNHKPKPKKADQTGLHPGANP